MFAASASSSLDIGRLLFELAIILCGAKVIGEIAERCGAPGVLGEILAGVVIGPSALGWVSRSDTLFVLAELEPDVFSNRIWFICYLKRPLCRWHDSCQPAG